MEYVLQDTGDKIKKWEVRRMASLTTKSIFSLQVASVNYFCNSISKFKSKMKNLVYSYIIIQDMKEILEVILGSS